VALKVGIPRGLLYYYYGDLWRNFFQLLGIEVVVSGTTTKQMLDQGSKIDEVCLPVKVYLGHVCALRGKVDWLFIPRVISVAPKQYSCPKMMGLPDVVRANFPDLPPMLSVDVNLRKSRFVLYRAVVDLGKRLGKSPWSSLKTWVRASRQIDAVAVKQDESVSGIRIGLVGHPYILKDSQISMDITGKLVRLGVRVIDVGDVPREEANSAAERLTKPIFWNYCQRLVGAALALIYSPRRLDGLVYVTSFSCGPDSLLGEMLGWHARKCNIPLLTLALDEHTGEAGLVTRLEAFVDMLDRRNKLCW